MNLRKVIFLSKGLLLFLKINTLILFIFLVLSKQCNAQIYSVDTSFIRKKIQSVNYRADGKLTKVIFFTDDELKSSEAEYKNDRKHGLRTWYYPSGKVKATCYYINNVRHGEFVTYFESGQISIKGKYKNGSFDNDYFSYYETGEVRYQCKYVKGKIEGQRIYYDKKGNKLLVNYFKKGIMEGPSEYFYENGQLKYSGTYKKGKMSGQRLCYDETGNLLNGTYTLPFMEKEYRQCTYIQGKPEGEMKSFRDSILLLSVNFNDGKPDGLARYYNLNGQDSIIHLYKNGNFIKEIKNQ